MVEYEYRIDFVHFFFFFFQFPCWLKVLSAQAPSLASFSLLFELQVDTAMIYLIECETRTGAIIASIELVT